LSGRLRRQNVRSRKEQSYLSYEGKGTSFTREKMGRKKEWSPGEVGMCGSNSAQGEGVGVRLRKNKKAGELGRRGKKRKTLEKCLTDGRYFPYSDGASAKWEPEGDPLIEKKKKDRSRWKVKQKKGASREGGKERKLKRTGKT